MTNIIDWAFSDIERKDLPQKPEGIGGSGYLDNLSAMQIGFGSKVFRGDRSGIWLGAKKFADAPFSVDMLGALTASSATITGMGKNFVSALVWTATDQDTASWASGTIKTSDGTSYSIAGGNTGNIAATTYIYLDPTTSITVLQTSTTATDAAGDNKILIAIVEAGAVGSECVISVAGSSGSTIDSDGIVTNAITSTKITALAITTDKLAANAVTAAKITANTITATQIAASTITSTELSVSTLSAISANLGTITAGSITASALIEIGGVHMVGNGVVMDNNIPVYFNKTGNTEIKADIRYGTNNDLEARVLLGSIYLSVASGSGNIHLNTQTGGVYINGSQKTAIVDTSEGYRALYCIEAPEVWFMDFCDNRDEIDPMFLEVTEGEAKFIKTEGGGYQVWRRRKGHGNFRFEEKTKRDYDNNNRFWANQYK